MELGRIQKQKQKLEQIETKQIGLGTKPKTKQLGFGTKHNKKDWTWNKKKNDLVKIDRTWKKNKIDGTWKKTKQKLIGL